jgi:hypothetical protein
MMRLGFARTRIGLSFAGTGPASVIGVVWQEGLNQQNGVVVGLDPVTEALQDVLLPMSGTLAAQVHQVGSETKLRHFAEIQEGDLMLDTPSPTLVTIYDGQFYSGTTPLSGLAEKGVLFEVPLGSGEFYRQKEVGEQLAAAWRVEVQSLILRETRLLRKST